MSLSLLLLRRHSQQCASISIRQRSSFLRPQEIPMIIVRNPISIRMAGNITLILTIHQWSKQQYRMNTLCSSAATIPEIQTNQMNDDDPSSKTWVVRVREWFHDILQKCHDFVLVTLRGVEVTFHLSPLLMLVPASILSSSLGGTDLVTEMTWWYTLQAVQRLGPSSVKLCQWMATRRDLFPSHFCDRLAVLHDKAFPHSWNHTRLTLEEAFGTNFQEKGLFIEKDSILGCGSAAQVYHGKLLEKDEHGTTVERRVAVKVLHPQLKRNVDRDIWLMETVAQFLHSIPIERIRMLNLPRATQTFVDILRRQTDLRIEAQNLRLFRTNFYQNDSDQEKQSEIVFPRPMEGWVHEKVLVEELADDANPIAASLKDNSYEGHKIRKRLGKQLCRAFFKMIFWDNFVHCDLHPGNVLVRHLRKEEQRKTLFGHSTDNKIVLLDAGIAFSLDPNDQKNLRDLFRAVVLNDGETAGRLMVERAKYERCSQMEGGVEAFATEMQGIVEEFHNRRKGGGLTFGSVRIGSLLNRVLDLCRDYGVEIDPAMSGVVLSCLVLEGLVRSLEPSLNLIDAAIPFVIGIGGV